MRGGRRFRASLEVAALTATLGAIVMALLSPEATSLVGVVPRAAAADGPQGPLVLEPAAVGAAGEPFALRPPAGARCEEDGSPRTGADSWRWHTFIVEEGRDPSTLRFAPTGPGTDFDAGDGEITAFLLDAQGNHVLQRLPALKPEGLINPDDLLGLVLDPGVYTLGDGTYQLGIACTDGGLEPRQWWSVTVTVTTSGAPFLSSEAGDGGSHPIAAAASPPAETTPTDAPAVPLSEEVAAERSGQAAGAEAPEPTEPLVVPPASPGGVSWAPLAALSDTSTRLPVVAWAGLVALFARITYLLARPVRIPPFVAP